MHMLKLITNCGGRAVEATARQPHSVLHSIRHAPAAIHITPLMAATAMRSMASTSTNTASPEQRKATWHTIYRLPLVRWAAAFNRLKIYQGSFTILGLPLAIAFEQAGQIPVHTTAVFAALGGSSLLTLALCSIALKNLIGFIYVNTEGDQFKFAYVDYWGRRREAIVAADDIKPLWEDAGKPLRFDFYKNVKLSSDSRISYKLLNNYGIIVQPDIYLEYFSS